MMMIGTCSFLFVSLKPVTDSKKPGVRHARNYQRIQTNHRRVPGDRDRFRSLLLGSPAQRLENDSGGDG